MADRYRKTAAELVNLNAKIKADTKAFLNNFAGEFSLGAGLDKLVEEFQRLRNSNATKPLPSRATSPKVS